MDSAVKTQAVQRESEGRPESRCAANSEFKTQDSKLARLIPRC